MDWVLFTVVLLGWVIAYWLLNKLINWIELRLTWWFHTLEDQSWLVMKEPPEEKYERLDRELRDLIRKEGKE